MDYGKLNIHVVSDNSGFPIPDATVQITSENEPENIIEEAVTNNVGQLNNIELAAPPVDYSMTPSANKPYSEYTITISASGFESVEINGAEIFSGDSHSERFSASSCHRRNRQCGTFCHSRPYTMGRLPAKNTGK